MKALPYITFLIQTKAGKAALVALSAYSIFTFGTCVGEFTYYLQH
jgi:hypothetical protein